MITSLLPRFDQFDDDQIAEAFSKFFKRELPAMQALVQSPQGQFVLGRLRGMVQEGEKPEIYHRCPECGFAHTIELS